MLRNEKGASSTPFGFFSMISGDWMVWSTKGGQLDFGHTNCVKLSGR
jgi:hypothetical protein